MQGRKERRGEERRGEENNEAMRESMNENFGFTCRYAPRRI